MNTLIYNNGIAVAQVNGKQLENSQKPEFSFDYDGLQFHENSKFYEQGGNKIELSDAQVAEVEVDPDTGIVKLLKMTVAHDVGRAINPLAVEGQLDGQIFSGMGQTMFEECIMENGQVLNPTFLDYKLPRPFEVP